MSSTNNSETADAKANMEKKEKEEKKNFSLNEILKSPMQIFFLIFTIFSGLLLIPFTYKGYHYYSNAQNHLPKG